MRNEHKCKLNTPFARAPLTPKLFFPSLSLLFTNHAVSFFLSSSDSCHFHLCLHETSMHFLFSITLYYIYIKYKHPSNPPSLSLSLILSLYMAETSEGRRRGSGKRAMAAGDAAVPPVMAPAPCGACKFLRRKCMSGCIFAPHFGTDQGAARFAAVHKVFGASNVSKLLLHIPVSRRSDAVVTISYEAQARLSDPVYGCVSTILALQQQVYLKKKKIDMFLIKGNNTK